MEFINAKETDRWKREHEKLRIEYKVAGMTDEEIDEIFKWDWQLYLEERRYIEHTLAIADFAEDPDEQTVDEILPVIEELGGTITEENRYFSGELTSCLDYTDSKAVHKALKRLGKKQWTILYLYAISGLSQREIADALKMSQQAVSKNILAIKNKIKNFSD